MVRILDGNSEHLAHVMGDLCLFYLFKAFDYIESSPKSDIFHPKELNPNYFPLF